MAFLVSWHAVCHVAVSHMMQHQREADIIEPNKLYDMEWYRMKQKCLKQKCFLSYTEILCYLCNKEQLTKLLFRVVQRNQMTILWATERSSIVNTCPMPGLALGVDELLSHKGRHRKRGADSPTDRRDPSHCSWDITLSFVKLVSWPFGMVWEKFAVIICRPYVSIIKGNQGSYQRADHLTVVDGKQCDEASCLHHKKRRHSYQHQDKAINVKAKFKEEFFYKIIDTVINYDWGTPRTEGGSWAYAVSLSLRAASKQGRTSQAVPRSSSQFKKQGDCMQ